MTLTFILIGIAAWTFSMILSDSDMIFGWWFKLIDNMPEWIAKPLGKCEYCLAGQLALWYYLIKYLNDYDLSEHILMTSLSIFTVQIINTLIYGKD
jgi:hypothetical protein